MLISMHTARSSNLYRNEVALTACRIVASVRTCLVVAVVGVCFGCSREPFDFVQASGRLTYEDGTPLPTEGGLRIVFAPTTPPINGEIFPPSGAAYPDENGQFASVSTSRPGGGLVRGEQKVAILYQDVDSKRFVPKAYTSPKSTPLVVHTDESPFDIKVPRP
jgi:hypothetical protein